MSIDGFEEQTAPLSDEERKYIPYIIIGLSKYRGPDQTVKTDAICKGLNALNEKKNIAACTMTPGRLRKCINSIRRSGELNFIIGTNQGYFIATDRAVVMREIESLEQRAAAIQAVADRMRDFLNDAGAAKQTSLNI